MEDVCQEEAAQRLDARVGRLFCCLAIARLGRHDSDAEMLPYQARLPKQRGVYLATHSARLSRRNTPMQT